MKFSNILNNIPEWKYFVTSDFGRSTKNFFISIYKNINTESNKFDILIISLLISFQFIPYYNLITNFWKWSGKGNSHHPISAWLMTYDGGFIRRGLAGELIKILEIITNLLPHVLVFVTSISIFVVLLIWSVGISGRKIPIYFFFSPVFFALTARFDVLFATDYFMFLLYLCALRIIVSNNNKIVIYLLVNLICVSAILIKEIYVFSCLPILILVYNLRFNNRFFSLNFLPFFALPILATVFIGLYASISEENLLKTVEYWNQIYRQKIPDFCCFENGYFRYFKDAYLAGNLGNMIHIYKKVLYGFLWVPLFWLFVWYFCGLFVAKVIAHYDIGKERIFLGFYYFSTFCSLPLYFLGWDFGRWILMASITSFLATYAYSTSKNNYLPKIVNKLQIRSWKSPLRFWQKILIVMFFGIPGFISDFGQVYYAAPIWYPLQFIISIPELSELGLLGK